MPHRDLSRGLAAAVALLAGCQSVTPGEAIPARIVDPDEASRTALESAVNQALGGDVLLADDALTDTDVLIIERRTPATPEGRIATGRNMDLPVQFRLVLDGTECVLIDTRESVRYTLENTRCDTL